MTGPGDRAENAALWQRLRLEASAAASHAAPDALALAAYSDGRLDEIEAEAIEAWLADNPETLTDILAAQQAAQVAPPSGATEALIARAAGLVPVRSDNVVPLRPTGVRAPHWRSAMAWSGLAASLFATSLVGFALGNDAYANYTGRLTAAESAIHELLDPPLNIFLDDEGAAS